MQFLDTYRTYIVLIAYFSGSIVIMLYLRDWPETWTLRALARYITLGLGLPPS